jgi:crotonobetainyl-CoA:carnitine CoA-transferase CaiB-like acyl-CoA transferase
VITDEQWQRLCQVLNKPAWAENSAFSTLSERIKNSEKLDILVGEWSINYTPEEVMKILQDASIPAGVVQGGQDLHNDPQLEQQHFFHKLDHPGLGDFTYSGMPARLSKTPYEVKRAPFLGEQTEYICTQLLDFTDEEFVELVADGVLE